jgi:hypothetical protein
LNVVFGLFLEKEKGTFVRVDKTIQSFETNDFTFCFSGNSVCDSV